MQLGPTISILNSNLFTEVFQLSVVQDSWVLLGIISDILILWEGEGKWIEMKFHLHWPAQYSIDLFTLGVLFSHFRRRVILLRLDSLYKLYPYSWVFFCVTVKQRNDTLENDTWSEMGKHYA